MELLLTWDFFVLVFFGVVIAYSFVIGRHDSVKIIISTYIAVVAGQGLGTFLSNTSPYSTQLLSAYGINVDITLLGGVKLLIFIATIIFIAVRSGLEIDYNKETSTVTNLVLTALFGFATAGLFLSTLLTFIGNTALLDPNAISSSTLTSLVEQSIFMRALIMYQGLWYALPALLLIIVGFLSHERE
jgi:hypothetical protein